MILMCLKINFASILCCIIHLIGLINLAKYYLHRIHKGMVLIDAWMR